MVLFVQKLLYFFWLIQFNVHVCAYLVFSTKNLVLWSLIGL